MATTASRSDGAAVRLLVGAPGPPFDPATWSGIPNAISTALRDLGVPLHAGDASLGRHERAVYIALGTLNARRSARAFGKLSPSRLAQTGQETDVFRRVRAARLSRQARAAGAGAGLIFSSSGIAPVRGLRSTTLVEDMTISQAARLPGHFPVWDSLPPAYVARRAARQAADQRAATTVAFLTRWAADAAIADYGLDRDRVVVIGSGSRFTGRPTPRDWSTPKFLFIGLDWGRKNGDLLVRSFTQVREQFPAAELHLVGGHPPIDQPGVVGHGVLRRDDPGDARELERLCSTCTCFVLPSTLEPGAVAHAEAVSQGLPSIGTINGGVRELFGDSGVAIDPAAAGALESAMLDLARPERAQALGVIAERRAPMVTWDAVARRLASASGWWSGSVIPLSDATP